MRHGRGVLPEVDYQRLAGADHKPFALLEHAALHNRAEHAVLSAGHVLPAVRLDGAERLVEAPTDLRALRRYHLAVELVVEHGRLERGVAKFRDLHARIVDLAVEDRGTHYRAANGGLPVLRVRPEHGLRSVGILDLELSAERAQLAGVVDDLVAPPARRDFCRERVPLALALPDEPGHVVGEEHLCLRGMRESWLERILAANADAVYVRLEHAQPRYRPRGSPDLLRIYLLGDEPARAGSRLLAPAVGIVDRLRVRSRNPAAEEVRRIRVVAHVLRRQDLPGNLSPRTAAVCARGLRLHVDLAVCGDLPVGFVRLERDMPAVSERDAKGCAQAGMTVVLVVGAVSDDGVSARPEHISAACPDNRRLTRVVFAALPPRELLSVHLDHRAVVAGEDKPALRHLRVRRQVERRPERHGLPAASRRRMPNPLRAVKRQRLVGKRRNSGSKAEHASQCQGQHRHCIELFHHVFLHVLLCADFSTFQPTQDKLSVQLSWRTVDLPVSI